MDSSLIARLQLPQMIQLLENAQPKDQAQIDLLERTFVAPLRVNTPCHADNLLLTICLRNTPRTWSSTSTW